MGKLKVTTLVLALASATAAFASDVYIEQIGDSTTITVVQSGGTGNTVGNSTTPAYINGSSNTVSVTQTGSSNTATLNVDGGSSTVTTSDVGSSNTTTVNIDGASGTTTTTSVTGDSNQVNICKTVDALGGCTDGITTNDTTQTVTITGDTNKANLNINSANAVTTLDVTGSNNVVDVSQTGVAGTVGHTITADHTGSNGQLSISQSGSNDQNAVITSNGDGLTLSVTQGD